MEGGVCGEEGEEGGGCGVEGGGCGEEGGGCGGVLRIMNERIKISPGVLSPIKEKDRIARDKAWKAMPYFRDWVYD